MPVLVVLLVVGIVFLYVRSSRKARSAWLAQLDLPGLWYWQQGDGQLALVGNADHGDFIRQEGAKESSGKWRIDGHRLVLRGQDCEESLDLQFFKQGNIGLENALGECRIYVKEANNVVPLKRH